eukprot:1144015-Pelagomonas_calceolata.AAC.2
MVSVAVHTTHSRIWTSEHNMINAVHIITQWASSISGRPIESNGKLLCVDCPCAWWLGKWVAYSMFEPLPTIVMVARDISRAKLVRFVHVQFKFVGQVVEYAYKLASTKRALELTSLNSHHRDQIRGTPCNPPDPNCFLFPLSEGDTWCLGPQARL